ncbi:MAG: hypothetical protein IT424_16365 [Pirellulales bacterium]|nr:hypothetical protein [Pirellulales bacterium]
MKIATSLTRLGLIWVLVATASALVMPASAFAHETAEGHLHFQKPNRAAASSAAVSGASSLQFRSSSPEALNGPASASTTAPAAAAAPANAAVHQTTFRQVARSAPAPPTPTKARPTVQQAPAKNAARPVFLQPAGSSSQASNGRSPDSVARHRLVNLDSSEPWALQPAVQSSLRPANYFDGGIDCDLPTCGLAEPTCGCGEPTCGICEPGCAMAEPGCSMEAACGIAEPGCGVVEPGCGVIDGGCGSAEPTCGCGDFGCDGVGCGSCVGMPGPDYWCFPVCLPRFKELSVWGGVHGFKGPRDAADFGGPSDGNFGFQEGVNLGGRAPFVGLLFPQLSYQLGYQAVQSQLSGNSAPSTQDRSQNFVTAGLFRRVPAGLQFGAVWDYQDDDFLGTHDFQQVRYELSIKSQRGHEIGFWGATHANTERIGGTEFQTVDQYNLFYRSSFRQAGEMRFWGGATNDGEGIFGADAYVPFSNRWSLQTGFNYLIPDEDSGATAAREESWNIFTNLVWHFGNTARASRTNPHRPLFQTADNGYMFIDARP